MEAAYLIKVDHYANNNKVYKMTPKDDKFLAEWGRVGNKMQSMEYPIGEWYRKYTEKINKGYVDKTELHKEEVIAVPDQKDTAGKSLRPIPNPAIRRMMDNLLAVAKHVVKLHYTVESETVTQAMLDEAQRAITNLYYATNVEQFNVALNDLFLIIPRKMSNVASAIAKNIKDFRKILEREQDLLDVMKGQVHTNAPIRQSMDSGGCSGQTILDVLGLEIRTLNDIDRQTIKRKLGNNAGQFSDAWRVVNQSTQKKFDRFLDTHRTDGKRPQVKLYWHGSRSENWYNILADGLVLQPNAVYTGSMFGSGLYFAPKAQKSIGYTSLSGSFWAGGTEQKAYLGLYALAYGRPYDVYEDDYQYRNLDEASFKQLSGGCHCMHAHAGSSLRNDEVIVYREDQATIAYLVEVTQ